jgi:hypothetical protein
LDNLLSSSKQFFRPWLVKCAIFIGYVLATLLRAPAVVFPGRLWAEEGGVYMAQALSSGLVETLFSTNQGYYSLFNQLAVTLATRLVTLEHAPLVTVFLAFLIQLLPALLLLNAQLQTTRSTIAKIAALGCVLFALPNYEIWLNTVNSQFYLALSAAIILAAPAGRPMKIWHYLVLALASLTGVITLLLTPLFWISALREHSRDRFVQAMILTVCALLQGIIFMAQPMARLIGFYPDLFTAVVLIKCLLLPVCGVEHADLASAHLWAFLANVHVMWIYLALILVIGAFFFIFRRWHHETQAFFLGGLIILLGSILCSCEMGASYELGQGHIKVLGGGRYYFAPNVLFALTLLSSIALQPIRHRFALTVKIVILSWILIIGGVEFFNHHTDRYKCYFTGPDWRAEVARWRIDTNYIPRMWPCPSN